MGVVCSCVRSSVPLRSVGYLDPTRSGGRQALRLILEASLALGTIARSPLSRNLLCVAHELADDACLPRPQVMHPSVTAHRLFFGVERKTLLTPCGGRLSLTENVKTKTHPLSASTPRVRFSQVRCPRTRQAGRQAGRQAHGVLSLIFLPRRKQIQSATPWQRTNRAAAPCVLQNRCFYCNKSTHTRR